LNTFKFVPPIRLYIPLLSGHYIVHLVGLTVRSLILIVTIIIFALPILFRGSLAEDSFLDGLGFVPGFGVRIIFFTYGLRGMG
jgi:hypothetical protein